MSLLEALPGDTVRFSFLLQDSETGIGIAGQAPTVVIRRTRDGFYLQAGGGSFGGAAASNPLVELDATNHPGLYAFDFDHSVDGQVDTYTAYMANPPSIAVAALQVESVKAQIGFAPGATQRLHFFVASTTSPLGIAGLAPEVSIQRESDGLYLNAAKTAFDSVAPVFHAMSELDAANQPGVYVFVLDQSVDPVPRRYSAFFRVNLSGGVQGVQHETIEFIGRDELPLPVGGLVFAGIAALTNTGRGSLNASAVAASGVIVPPLRYRVYVAKSEDIESDPPGLLFQAGNLLAETSGPSLLIHTHADRSTLLNPLVEYSVGIKVMDGRGTEDSNTAILTAMVTGSSKTVVPISALSTARAVP